MVTLQWNMRHSGPLFGNINDTPKDQHSFGFKRMMVREEDKKVFLYFVGELPFGKEVFERDK
jgi:hypothetical protein